MKNFLLTISALLLTVAIFAQTPQQLTRVKKETNSKKLLAEANIWRQQAEEQKAIAVQAALLNGWQIIVQTDTSCMELQRLDKLGNPIYYVTSNAAAAITTSTNKLYSSGGLNLNLDGSDMIAGEWDGGGVLRTHQEFTDTGSSRVTQGDSPASNNSHATHVAGTIIAGGVTAIAKGMAYNASLLAYDWNNNLSEMAEAASNGMLISNHSYGDAAGWHSGIWYGDTTVSKLEDFKFGFYDNVTAWWDYIAQEAPYFLIVKAAMNDRGNSGTGYPTDGPYDCVPTYGTAKNILTVGAVYDVLGGYNGNPNSVAMSGFSSWGPTDDGRIKPDICGNGIGLYSTDKASNSAYINMSGTSMASPNVTGTLLLLQEHYHDLFSDYMKSATLKALAIHTADECGSNVGPDYMFGWGLLNAKTAANVITNRNVSTLIKAEPYNGTTSSIEVKATGNEPLRATLVWTDPWGPFHDNPILDPTDIMLVNDLDMTITGAKTTYSPYKLDKDNPSNAATTGNNDVDNVEQIHIDSPTNSVYTITITHEGSISGGSQDFSLIVTGIDVEEPAVVTVEPSDVTATSVTFDGETTSENGFEISERGFVYSTSLNPDINATKIIVGSGLGTFNTSVTGLSPNTTYHVRAYAINSQGTGYGDDKDFTTTSTTTWDGSSWDGGAPTASIHAVINGTYTTSGNLECNNLTINSGKTFNLSVNHGVTVNGDFVNNGTFNIKSSASGIGSLITLGAVTNSGSFNMERYVTDDQWHYISIPMDNMTANLFNGDFLQYWDETDTTFYEITNPSYPLVNGYGYALWSSLAQTYLWTGTPYSGNKSTNLSFTNFANNLDDYEGANLMGNIYPSSIDWSTLDEGLYGSVYYWNGSSYSSWNSGGGTNSGTKYIAPGQGFFIVVGYSGGSLSLGNANRTHSGTATYWKSDDARATDMRLISSGNGKSDDVLIGILEESTDGFDKRSDAYKFHSGDSEVPEIYTITSGKKLSIDRRNQLNIIQLGYICGENGQYSISGTGLQNNSDAQLEDTKLNHFHHLSNGTYSFNWNTTDSEERFILHLKATGTDDLEAQAAQVYAANQRVYVRMSELNSYSEMVMYDLSGRVILTKPLAKSSIQSFELNESFGAYLVQLKGESGTKSFKIVL